MPMRTGSGSSSSRLLARLGRGLVWLLLGVLVLLALLWSVWPWLIGHLAPRLAPAVGLESLSVAVGRPGFTGMRVEQFQAATAQATVAGEDAELVYRWPAVLSGQLDAVEVAAATVVMHPPPASAGAAETAGVSSTEPAPMPAALFAAVPARRVSVDELTVRAPSVPLEAQGSASLTPERLQLDLRTAERAEPAPLADLSLALRLTPGGEGRVLLVSGAGEPLLELHGAAAQALEITGRIQLPESDARVWLEMLNLPFTQAALNGTVEAVLPWPLPDQAALAAVTARGRLSEVVLGGDGWQLCAGGADWQLQQGRVTASARGELDFGGERYRVQTQLDSLEAGPWRGSGVVTVTPAPAASDAERGRVDWQLEAGVLALDGRVAVAGDSLDRVAALLALPPGDGAVTVTATARLPWPLPEDLAPLSLPVRGTLAGRWQMADASVSVTGLQAQWQLQDGRLSGQLETVAGRGGLALPVTVDLESLEPGAEAVTARGRVGLASAGEVSVTAAYRRDAQALEVDLKGRLAADGALLAESLAGWQAPYDASAGQVDFRAALSGPPAALSGQGHVDVTALDAHYDAYLIRGLSGRLTAEVENGTWLVPKADFSIGRVDVGVSLTDVHSGGSWVGDVVNVAASRAELLGGVMQVAPFDYRLDTGQGETVVALSGIALDQLLALEGEQISGTGTLEGTVPLTLRNHQPMVSHGQVRALPPGGMIRVSPELARGTGQPGLDFALRALRDFRYSTLSADAAYDTDGDLTLAVRLEGRNPDIEEGRPIHYNVTVNENVPTLLRSLRLEERLTRSIERRVTN